MAGTSIYFGPYKISKYDEEKLIWIYKNDVVAMKVHEDKIIELLDELWKKELLP